jgi:hypothetical protein
MQLRAWRGQAISRKESSAGVRDLPTKRSLLRNPFSFGDSLHGVRQCGRRLGFRDATRKGGDQVDLIALVERLPQFRLSAVHDQERGLLVQRDLKRRQQVGERAPTWQRRLKASLEPCRRPPLQRGMEVDRHYQLNRPSKSSSVAS